MQPAQQPGFVARLRIFNPDGSEAELSGNGARIAILYLRHRGWTESDTFSIETIAGEIRPTITGPTTCRVDMGRARLLDEGEIRGHAYRWIEIGNPQCAIRVEDPDASRSAGGGRADRDRPALPQPHERLVLDRTRAGPDPRPDLRARRG